MNRCLRPSGPIAALSFALALWAGGTGPARAQETPPDDSPRLHLQELLSFESATEGPQPAGWNSYPPGTIALDAESRHGGARGVRIDRRADSAGGFSTITMSIPIDFAGTQIEMRGYLRTEDVTGFVGLWMREDGESPSLAFNNMQKQALAGTHDWMEYSIVLPVHPEGRVLYFGVLLVGTGKAWADDLQLLVDARPIQEAPARVIPKTALDDDHQFDKGSGVILSSLSRAEIRNFAMLGKVWGFLKYHHPAITSGTRHWDYDMLRVFPEILAVGSQKDARAVIARWIAALGEVPRCGPCAGLPDANLQMPPRLEWLGDERRLGAPLSRTLLDIRRNRAAGTQFYVSLDPDVGNPVFHHEPGYSKISLPDAGFQLLALFRFWNVVEYWFPYRDVMDEDWDAVLEEFIPRVALATSRDAYLREMLALVARAHDSHANLWSALEARPPTGACGLPVSLRFIGEEAVVTGDITNAGPDAGPDSGLQLGDLLTAIDGVAVPSLVRKWAPYYAASNETAMRRDLARSMTRGPCGPTEVRVRRGSRTLRLRVERRPPPAAGGYSPPWHDLPGETFRLLSDQVAYIKLSSVKGDDVAGYIERARGTKGLVVDIRNYPSQFVVFTLGSLLVDAETPFVRFTQADLTNPGAFYWGGTLSQSPEEPHYAGKVVILVDETSMSQAEYTAMALRIAPRAVVVGSTTTGADGNVSPFSLPVDLGTMISGLGIYYPDGRATQRIGIVPDLFVTPTIAGLREHRDEVLEAGLRQILGDAPTTAALMALYMGTSPAKP